MSISEVALGLIPIIFTVVGMIFLLSQVYYILYGKESKAKILAIEKYLSRSGSRNQSNQIMYREIIEFHHNGSHYIFSTAGKNFISKEIGSTVSVLILNNNPAFVRLKLSYHYFFGIIFTIAGLSIGYFLSYKQFEHSNFLYSCIISLFLFSVFYKVLKVKSKGAFRFSTLFETKFIKEGELKSRDIFWNTRDIQKEKSKNAKAGLVVTLIFGILYLFVFNGCYKKLSSDEIELIKNTIFNFENFDLLLNHSNKGPIVGFLACLVLAPLLLHSVLYSLRRL